MTLSSKIRTGQAITTYGIGALVPLADQGSVIVAGLDMWENVQYLDEIDEPRLKSICNVEKLYKPPSGRDNKKDIPVFRFPTLVSCDKCEILQKHSSFCSDSENTCPIHNTNLIPSRIIVACLKGHIDDFPYYEWVHDGYDEACTRTQSILSITNSGTSATLSSTIIHCKKCNKKRTLKDVFKPNMLRSIKSCQSFQPWLYKKHQNVYCDDQLTVLQRGASNVWFPIFETALLIPPWSETLFQKVLNPNWDFIKDHVYDEVVFTKIMAKGAKKYDYTIDQLREATINRIEGTNFSKEFIKEEIRKDEYKAIIKGQSPKGIHDEFISEPASPGPIANKWFKQIMVLKKVLEVRVLKSFTRITQRGDSERLATEADLSRSKKNWLPAITVHGEGVFLSLNNSLLEKWEKQENVIDRVNRIPQNIRSTKMKNYDTFIQKTDEDLTNLLPRFILIHTLSHILINQWAIDSGYPSSSLRERLYVDTDMAGVLIYTSDSDSSGSLGGVIAQAEATRLDNSLDQALRKALWCSNDPLCIENLSGFESVNIGACHACILLQEVSCEMLNGFLDRGLLVETPTLKNLGFFTIN